MELRASQLLAANLATAGLEVLEAETDMIKRLEAFLFAVRKALDDPDDRGAATRAQTDLLKSIGQLRAARGELQKELDKT